MGGQDRQASGEPSDEELVARALNADGQAFDSLVQRHFGLVFLVGYARLGDRETAEDLAQEVFLRAHLFLRRVDPARFPAWLSRVARNLAIDWRRRGQTVSRLLPLLPLEGAMDIHANRPSQQPRAQAAAAEEQALIHQEIQRLPPLQRELVLLHHCEELSQREIARRLGMHPSTVSRQMRRALAALRRSLTPVLRESIGALRPSPRAATRASSLAAAAAALSASAKASLAATAQASVAAKLSSAPGAIPALVGLFAKGAAVMTTAKGITAVVGAAAVIGGAVVVLNDGGNSSPGPRVRIMDESRTLPGTFVAAYSLAPGEDVKRVAPPFLSARLEAYRVGIPPQAAAALEGPDWMIIRQDDAGLQIINSGTGFERGHRIDEVVQLITDLRPDEIEGPANLLRVGVLGDFVIRFDASQDEIVAGLAPALSEALGSPVRLEFRDVTLSAIVARGEFQHRPLPDSEYDVEIYGRSRVGGIERSNPGVDLNQMMGLLGRAVGRRVVNEATAPQGLLSVGQRPGDLESEERLVLQHLTEQTGITFTEETRTVRQLFVESAG